MSTLPPSDEHGSKPADSRFVVDGHRRAVEGIREEVLPEIRKAVEAEYAVELSQAGPIHSCWIRLRMNREVARRLRAEIAKKAPRDALYGVNQGR